MASQAAGVDIATLQPEQLRQLGDLLNEELGVLGKHLQSLQGAVERFHRSGLAVEALGRAAEGTPALLPLTQSLYAPGTLGSTDKVLIDVGTGYFVEARERERQRGREASMRPPHALFLALSVYAVHARGRGGLLQAQGWRAQGEPGQAGRGTREGAGGRTQRRARPRPPGA